METKVCKKCGRELPIEEFYKAKNSKDGHMNICKECFNQQRKQYYQEHKEEIAEYQKQYFKQYYQDNRETILEQRKEYYQDNKEEIAEQRKQHYQDNKEEITEYNKQYYQDNKDAIADKRKQYYQGNKETILEQQKQYQKQYYQTPIGRANNLLNAYKTSDKKYNRGECTLTAQWMVDNIFSGQKCIFCGESDWKKLGCDRIDNSKPHTPDNVNPCCEECNNKRGRKDFEEFLLTI